MTILQGISRSRRRPSLLLGLTLLLVLANLYRASRGSPAPSRTNDIHSILQAQTLPATRGDRAGDDQGVLRSSITTTTALPRNNPNNLTVHLVIASTSKDDTLWTSRLEGLGPNLRIIRYISDSTTAPFRPRVPRVGREATIYHTYFHDFYDSLPDLAIMIHPHEQPWHIEPVIGAQSLLFALDHLDVDLAHRRGYANLRIGWKEACPAWIDTTRPLEDESRPIEAPYMSGAMFANFGTLDADVPKMFAGPCCSQFAVSREAIRRHPRAQYQRSMDWLVQTSWPDSLTGRTWEHMFHWMFTGNAIDCPVEWKAYCGMYGLCFDRRATIAEINTMWEERAELKDDMGLWQQLRHPQVVMRGRARVQEIERRVWREIERALERGRDEDVRREATEDLFTE